MRRSDYTFLRNLSVGIDLLDAVVIVERLKERDVHRIGVFPKAYAGMEKAAKIHPFRRSIRPSA